MKPVMAQAHAAFAAAPGLLARTAMARPARVDAPGTRRRSVGAAARLRRDRTRRGRRRRRPNRRRRPARLPSVAPAHAPVPARRPSTISRRREEQPTPSTPTATPSSRPPARWRLPTPVLREQGRTTGAHCHTVRPPACAIAHSHRRAPVPCEHGPPAPATPMTTTMAPPASTSGGLGEHTSRNTNSSLSVVLDATPKPAEDCKFCKGPQHKASPTTASRWACGARGGRARASAAELHKFRNASTRCKNTPTGS